MFANYYLLVIYNFYLKHFLVKIKAVVLINNGFSDFICRFLSTNALKYGVFKPFF